jgi:hypothetical protein
VLLSCQNASRAARSIVGGFAHQVVNRANGRLWLFNKPAGFLAFERILSDVHRRGPLRILGYSLILTLGLVFCRLARAGASGRGRYGLPQRVASVPAATVRFSGA